MLDMAFQLLAFFIMTYHPAPAEGQFSMSLLPASPAIDIQSENAPQAEQPANADVPASLRTLTTTLQATADGELGRVTVGENEVQGMDQLEAKLGEILGDKTLPFDQALIQCDGPLKYEELIRVIDVFSRLGITKISFSELEGAAAGG
ncbi:MAG: biopolymer transporter ExbD [Isosphaeraceae bacterium]|nr:biopolymer transporter ExbD [Isosphaeraceae bacterium]